MLEKLHNRRRLTGLSLGLGFDNSIVGPINHEINKGFCLNTYYDNKPLSIKKTGKELIDKVTSFLIVILSINSLPVFFIESGLLS